MKYIKILYIKNNKIKLYIIKYKIKILLLIIKLLLRNKRNK